MNIQPGQFREGGRVKIPPVKVTKEELEGLELLSIRNEVIMRIEVKNTEKKTASGLIMVTDTDFNPVAHANRIGVVYKVPEKLIYNKKIPTSLQWNTNLDLLPGDEVLFSYFDSENGLGLECEGILYKFVRYDKCYARKRDGEIKILNGWIVCEPIFKPKSFLDIYDDIDMSIGKVFMKGDLINSYNVFGWNSDEFDVEIGDTLSFKKVGGGHIQYYIEDDYHRSFFDRKLFIKHRPEINGIIHATTSN